MSNENITDFYQTLGFEEAEIEDGLDALLLEPIPNGGYALVTTEEGITPNSLKKAVIFAVYTSEGSFLWSATFKNSYVFRDIWNEAEVIEHKFAAIQKHRDSNDYFK